MLLGPIVVLLLTVGLRAQPTSTASPEETITPTPAAAAAVPAAGVVPRLEATLNFLRTSPGNGSEASPELLQVTNSVSDLEKEVLDSGRQLPAQISANLTPTELEQQESRWKAFRERLSAQQKEIQECGRRIEKSRAQSLTLSDSWEAPAFRADYRFFLHF